MNFLLDVFLQHLVFSTQRRWVVDRTVRSELHEVDLTNRIFWDNLTFLYWEHEKLARWEQMLAISMKIFPSKPNSVPWMPFFAMKLLTSIKWWLTCAMNLCIMDDPFDVSPKILATAVRANFDLFLHRTQVHGIHDASSGVINVHKRFDELKNSCFISMEILILCFSWIEIFFAKLLTARSSVISFWKMYFNTFFNCCALIPLKIDWKTCYWSNWICFNHFSEYG